MMVLVQQSLDALALVVILPVAVLAALFLLQVAASFLPPRSEPRSSPKTPKVVVVMPAHNEAAIIQRSLPLVVERLAPNATLLVVADNCTDDTARLARELGADVLVRTDPARRGKGYALDAAIRHLECDPPEVVVILDADCTPERGAIARISERCLETNRPVQAFYDMRPPPGTSSDYLAVAMFAWRVKNFIRPVGLKRLGWPCQLMGTGMAFPWLLISNANLATGHLVEDMMLGLELAEAGSAPQFEPRARIYSDFPSSVEGQRTQRHRWETGHLSVVRDVVPGSLWRGLRTGNWGLTTLALDAAIPPLSSFVLAIAACVAGAGLAGLATGSALATAIAASAAIAIFVAVLAAWSRVGTDVLPPSRFVALAGYVANKLAIYLDSARKRPAAWIRSKRD